MTEPEKKDDGESIKKAKLSVAANPVNDPVDGEEIPTTERLARALEFENGSGSLDSMIKAARAGFYDDYKSPLATPMMQLVADLQKLNLPGLASRAMNGEFDSTKAEAEAWFKSNE